MEESKRAKKTLTNDTFGVPGCISGGRARVTEKELKSARAGVSTFQSGRGSAATGLAAALAAAGPWQRRPCWRRRAVENRGRFSAQTALCSLDTCTVLRHHKHQVHHYRCHMDIDPDLEKLSKNYQIKEFFKAVEFWSELQTEFLKNSTVVAILTLIRICCYY